MQTSPSCTINLIIIYVVNVYIISKTVFVNSANFSSHITNVIYVVNIYIISKTVFVNSANFSSHITNVTIIYLVKTTTASAQPSSTVQTSPSYTMNFFIIYVVNIDSISKTIFINKADFSSCITNFTVIQLVKTTAKTSLQQRKLLCPVSWTWPRNSANFSVLHLKQHDHIPGQILQH